jgi:predicted GIY-YIG superfamily endonuclease
MAGYIGRANHYTYLLQSKTDDMMYIGVRSCACAPEDDNYWGSSRNLPLGKGKDLSTLCDKYILGVFNSRTEAVEDEIKRHSINDVAINPEFWNKAKQTRVGFDTSGMPGWNKGVPSPLKGKPGFSPSEETREKLRQHNLGKKASDETKAKMSALQSTRKRGPRSEATKRKLSEANMGKYLGKVFDIVKCPNCSKLGGETGMKSWHFNNCRVGGVSFQAT